MSASDLDFIPAGTVFTSEQITYFADPDTRNIEQAIIDADLLVSVPSGAGAIPEEITDFLDPALTQRLQTFHSGAAAAAVVQRWAEIDPRIVAVVNPHPQFVGEIASDSEDAILAIETSAIPVLKNPVAESDTQRLVDTCGIVAAQGQDVYERTLDNLTVKFIAHGLADGGSFTRLTFLDQLRLSDTDQLSAVVSLTNFGDEQGNEQGDVQGDTTSATQSMTAMGPKLIRDLAAAHRDEFEFSDESAVGLNLPGLAGEEIRATSEIFQELAPDAATAGLRLSAVQADFLRVYLQGSAIAEALQEPGDERVELDPDHIDVIAYACKRTWDAFRETL